MISYFIYLGNKLIIIKGNLKPSLYFCQLESDEGNYHEDFCVKIIYYIDYNNENILKREIDKIISENKIINIDNYNKGKYDLKDPSGNIYGTLVILKNGNNQSQNNNIENNMYNRNMNNIINSNMNNSFNNRNNNFNNNNNNNNRKLIFRPGDNINLANMKMNMNMNMNNMNMLRLNQMNNIFMRQQLMQMNQRNRNIQNMNNQNNHNDFGDMNQKNELDLFAQRNLETLNPSQLHSQFNKPPINVYANMLDSKEQEEIRMEIADSIYEIVYAKYPFEASKITGMINEKGIEKMNMLLSKKEDLDDIIDKAYEMIVNSKKSENGEKNDG
jgi:hypothetical protein